MKKISWFFSFALSLLFAVQSHAQTACPPQPDLLAVIKRAKPENSKDAGFLWEIERNGRVSHLYGTMHILPEKLFLPGRKTVLALQSSDFLALEINILDPAMLSDFKAEIKRAPDIMKPTQAQQDTLVQLAKKFCVDTESLGGYPWSYKYMQVFVSQVRSAGFEVAFGREISLSILATEWKKPILSLESAKTQVEALTAKWDARTPQIDKYLADMENGSANRVMTSMLNIWANNQLDKLDAIDSWCECKDDDFQKRLIANINDDRNSAMAAEIDRQHLSGKKVFAAVGALHMTGSYALPKLMQQKGYVVRRVF